MYGVMEMAQIMAYIGQWANTVRVGACFVVVDVFHCGAFIEA